MPGCSFRPPWRGTSACPKDHQCGPGYEKDAHIGHPTHLLKKRPENGHALRDIRREREKDVLASNGRRSARAKIPRKSRGVLI